MTQTPLVLRSVRIWDLPTRLFHWILVLLVAFSWWSGEQGGEWLPRHFLSGYAILTLVLYRIVWGFVGSRTARFSDFFKGPKAALHHARLLLGAHKSQDVGHNPLGGWMIMVLLAMLLVQTGTGLFSEDRELNFGPLATLVSEHTSRLLSRIHGITVNLLLVLIGIHVAAVLFYLVIKRDNLIGAMFTGRRRLDLPEGADPVQSSPLLALAVLIVCAAVVYGIVHIR